MLLWNGQLSLVSFSVWLRVILAYYCLNCLQVSDWLKRTYIEGNDEQVMVGVDECNAFFVLSMEEEAVNLIINEIKMKLLGWFKTSQLSLLSIMQWFDVYYQYLRSVMIKRRHRRCSLDEAEKFFMYSSGNPVDNPCEDLKKLHDEWVHSNKPLFYL